MGRHPVEAHELVEQLRRGRSAEVVWAPLPPEPLPRPDEVEPMVAHTGLHYAHHHTNLPDRPTAGGGVRGWYRRTVGRMVFGILFKYLREERELISNLVQLNDALAKRCDRQAVELEDLREALDDRAVARAENEADLALRVASLEQRGSRSPNGD